MSSGLRKISTLALCLLSGTALSSARAEEKSPISSSSPSPLRTTGYTVDDEMFTQPFVDKDEMRNDGSFRYRYIHGGFTGTDTRFSFHFPENAAWQGRFFQYITPVPDSENLSQGLKGEEDRIGAALSSGAYFIETNGGGPNVAKPMSGVDPTIGAWRANAASARFSRFVAQQIYGPRPHIYGYSYGGSGGAYRTIGALENTKGVWDGAVPFVMGSPMAIPSMFTVRLHAMRVLGNKLDSVVDALEPGGSGKPTAGLTPVENAAYEEVTRMGFEPQSWYAWRTMGPHAFALLFGGIRMADAGFFNDFWTKPGYEGHDHPELYAADREQLDTRIVEVITATRARQLGMDSDRIAGMAKGTADQAWKAMGLSSAGEMPVAFRLADRPKSKALMLSDLVLPSGKKLVLADVSGDIALAGINDPRVLLSAKAGDAVRLDNSDILAVETYHRHQVPDRAQYGNQYPVWDQFRDAQGKALYPQRPLLLGPLFTKSAAGSIPTGKFEGKVILLENLWDREALPWQGDWYRGRVAENAGRALDGKFRIWYTDRALHGDTSGQDDPSRVVSYLGVLQQALRDLSAWVEKGKDPAPSTRYTIIGGQVQVPATAAGRRGIQPVVTLTANGGPSAVVKTGQPVVLSGTIQVPPGAGTVVAAEWDFDGDGVFDATGTVARGKARVTATVRHAFAKRGTYFAVLRGVSQREGDASTPFARIQNLARARIVVE